MGSCASSGVRELSVSYSVRTCAPNTRDSRTYVCRVSGYYEGSVTGSGQRVDQEGSEACGVRGNDATSPDDAPKTRLVDHVWDAGQLVRSIVKRVSQGFGICQSAMGQIDSGLSYQRAVLRTLAGARFLRLLFLLRAGCSGRSSGHN